MQIKDGFTVEAPPDTVWAFIHDIPRVSACVPGAAGVAETEPDVYAGKLTAKVGAVRAAFTGQATITERVVPERLSASFKADDRALASSVTGTFTVQVTAVEAGTQVDYDIDVAMRGRLAQIGFTAVQQTAKRLTAEFVKCLQATLLEGGAT
ncbi:MAG TPA: SRPBCC domain-containing protein [Anaerolineae bacterium]|jgi:carbon monoxide dehydrogenase subunit G